MKRTPLTRSTRIRHRSKKMAKHYRDERIPLVQQLLATPTACQRCTSAIATDLHEIKSRARGGSTTDLDNIALLCRPCHSWITTHPADATAEGWLKHAWD